MRKVVLTLLITTVVAGMGSIVSANETIIKYRQGHLAAMGGHTNAIFQMFAGPDIPPERMNQHARALVELTNALQADLEKMFPAGSGEGKTDALPEVWEDWEAFSEAAEKAKNAAADVAAALDAKDNAALGAAMKGMGGACKGCHKELRKQ